MNRSWRVAALCISLTTSACSAVKVVSPNEAEGLARNLDFEAGTHAGAIPNGWGVVRDAGSPDDYTYEVDTITKRSGAASVRITARGETNGHGGVYQCLNRPTLSPGRLALSGYVRTSGATGDGASLWLRASDDQGESLTLENRKGGRARGTSGWLARTVEISVPNPDDVARVCFGFYHEGPGSAWVDDLDLVSGG